MNSSTAVSFAFRVGTPDAVVARERGRERDPVGRGGEDDVGSLEVETVGHDRGGQIEEGLIEDGRRIVHVSLVVDADARVELLG